MTQQKKKEREKNKQTRVIIPESGHISLDIYTDVGLFPFHSIKLIFI